MNFQLLSKNNVGSAFLLLVIILLSQARTFDYFVNNYLGRVLLITAIIVLSYINKILGVVLVLFVIIMMNRIDFLYLEGMQNASDAGLTANGSSSENNVDMTPEQKKALEEKVKEVINENKGTQDSNESKTTDVQSVEGFNVTETEDDMKKGKNSNTIPVDENVKNSDAVEAFDSFEFKDNYASI
jgi:hypothetical protein